MNLQKRLYNFCATFLSFEKPVHEEMCLAQDKLQWPKTWWESRRQTLRFISLMDRRNLCPSWLRYACTVVIPANHSSGHSHKITRSCLCKEAKPTVLLFYCSDCPTSKRAMDELQKLSTSARYKDSRTFPMQCNLQQHPGRTKSSVVRQDAVSFLLVNLEGPLSSTPLF